MRRCRLRLEAVQSLGSNLPSSHYYLGSSSWTSRTFSFTDSRDDLCPVSKSMSNLTRANLRSRRLSLISTSEKKCETKFEKVLENNSRSRRLNLISTSMRALLVIPLVMPGSALGRFRGSISSLVSRLPGITRNHPGITRNQ